MLESIGLQPDMDRGTARCFYAKAQVKRHATAICRYIHRVRSACAARHVSVIAIDLDEDKDDRLSKVVNLYCTP